MFQAYAKTILFGLAFLEIAACGARPTIAPSQGQNSLILPLTAQAAQIQFPAANGLNGTATVALTAAPPAGTTVTLSSTTSQSLVPVPLGTQAAVLVAFLVTSTQSVQLSTLPAWQVTAPSNTALTPPYGIEAFDGQSYLASYAATSSANTISANSFGPAFSIIAGHTYVFEVVQNPILSQFPH